jgi:phage terminase large subunit-like protein
VTATRDDVAVTESLDLLHALITDTGGRWGDIATDWQRADARAVLAPREGEPRQHWLGRPKGGSKSTDLAAILCAWLATEAPPMAEGFALAADEEQSNRLLDKARGFIQRTPGLSGTLTVEAHRILGPAGARVQALAADVAGTEGLLTPFVVVDELPNHASTTSARGMWTSVFSALPKWPGMRLVVIGHAGDPAHWSFKILERARKSRSWRVNEVPGPLPWVTEDSLEEQRAGLPEWEYARRHLNIWTASADRLTSLDDLRACVTLDGPQEPKAGARYVIGVDLGIKSDRTVAAVCHGERDGAEVRVVLDRMEVWAGTKAKPVNLGVVEDWLREAARRYHRAELVVDPWQSIGMVQRLRGSGVRATEFAFSQQSVGRLAVTLHTAIRDHHLALPNDEELIDELANVRLRETSPGVLRMDHDSDKHDDRATALGLAAHHLLGQPRGQGAAFIEVWRRELAARGDAGTEIARDVRRRTARHDAVERGRLVQQRLCRHFWGPPFDSGERICVHCELRHNELAESVAP